MANAQNAPRAVKGGFRLTSFPKEFERNLWEALDRRFYLILLISFALVYGAIIYLANVKYSKEQLNSQIRQKYIQKLYKAELVTETAPVEKTKGGAGIAEQPEEKPQEVKDERAKRDVGKRAEGKGQSAAQRRAMARARARARAKNRASMEQAVAGTGVLAELTAGGGGGSGEAVADVLGESGGGGFANLDKALSEVGGLQTASSSTRRSKLGARQMGGGTGSGEAGIDDLIEGGIGPSGSANISRRGNFSIKFGKGSVSGKASKSTSRSAETIGRIVNKHTDAIVECYRKEARINPSLKGSMKVMFTINYNGRVSRVRIVQSSIRNKKVESCVTRRIRSWRFQPIDRKEGSVTFTQKFVFVK